MMTELKEDIAFISNLGEIGNRPGIETVEGGLGVRPHVPALLSSQEVKKAIGTAIHDISVYLDSIADQTGELAFALEEVEFTLVVSQSGKVNVFLADVGGSVQGGLKLKWQRRRT